MTMLANLRTNKHRTAASLASAWVLLSCTPSYVGSRNCKLLDDAIEEPISVNTSIDLDTPSIPAAISGHMSRAGSSLMRLIASETDKNR